MEKSAAWTDVRRVFDTVLEVDEAARSRLLDAEDPHVARRVRQLLDADRTAAAAGAGRSPLDRIALDLLERSGATGNAVDLAGRTLGDYSILERLSSGGMGDVYLAERRVPPAGRRVAVKVLKRGLETDAVLRRFRREQETLAALVHENVVGFLDDGALDDGRPYLVMEYVEGAPITEHARTRGLGVRARLQLFLDVCEAVACAHRSLILHRDLKPSNVMVTPNGTPKLVDFGVATLLQPGGDAAATDPHGLAPLSLGYASPEQLRGERLSVATDVYGLGLVLYELLADTPAFAERSLAGLLRGAGDAEIPAASTAARAEVAAQLRGDLDAICRRALRQSPTHRYASVEQLAADVAAHLAGEAVSARRGSARDRATRWLRRNRWPVASAAAVFVSLTALLLGTWLGKQRAEANASRGWGAHGQARRAVEFLEGVLTEVLAVGPAAALADAEARVAVELEHSPESEALARLALAHTALTSGRADAACTQLERAIALVPAGGLNARDHARALHLLGRARDAAGRPGAEDALREAVERFAALSRADEPGLAAARATLDLLERAPRRR